MRPSLGSISESLANPNNRFKTLTDLFAISENGMPSIVNHSKYYECDVIVNGSEAKVYILKDSSAYNDEQRNNAYSFLKLTSAEYFTRTTYLEKELLVFDQQAGQCYMDLILEMEPEGHNLFDIICKGLEYDIITGIITKISKLSSWMLENKISHGNINFKDTIVTINGICLKRNLTIKRVLPENDLKILGVLALTLYCCSCSSAFRKKLISDLITRNSVSPLLNEIVNSSPNLPDSAKTLNELVKKDNPTKEDIELIPTLIGQLAKEPTTYLTFTDQVFPNYFSESKPEYSALPQFDYVGNLHDMLRRARTDGKWCYLDKNDTIVIEGRYLFADDFREGLAVVETEKGMGVIKTDGSYIIQPSYDDIEIDETASFAAVTLNGKSALFSRIGENLTGFIFDRILSSSEGLIAVEINNRYGYIDTNGTMVINNVFEDATTFNSGIARVTYHGRDYIIDRKGDFVGEIPDILPKTILN